MQRDIKVFSMFLVLILVWGVVVPGVRCASQFVYVPPPQTCFTHFEWNTMPTQTTGGPGPLDGHAMTTVTHPNDPNATDYIILFGGQFANYTMSNLVFRLDRSVSPSSSSSSYSWSLLAASSSSSSSPTAALAVPSARMQTSIVYLSSSSSAYIFGGVDDNMDVLSDCHAFNIKTMTWSQCSSTVTVVTTGAGTGAGTGTGTGIPLGALFGHTLTAVSSTQFVLFGGFDGLSTMSSALYLYDATLDVWTMPIISGVPPTPRAWHTAIYHPQLFAVIIFGGQDQGFTRLQDTTHFMPGNRALLTSQSALTGVAADWSSSVLSVPSYVSSPPFGRSELSVVLYRSSLLYFGGLSNNKAYSPTAATFPFSPPAFVNFTASDTNHPFKWRVFDGDVNLYEPSISATNTNTNTGASSTSSASSASSTSTGSSFDVTSVPVVSMSSSWSFHTNCPIVLPVNSSTGLRPPLPPYNEFGPQVPTPRMLHAAAKLGSDMVVFGGNDLFFLQLGVVESVRLPPDACDAGRYLDAPTQQCRLCPPSTFALAGSSSCTPCPGGTFCASYGSILPTLCPVATFQPSSASTSCVPCAVGSVSPGGSVQCSICPAGSLPSSDGSSCVSHIVYTNFVYPTFLMPLVVSIAVFFCVILIATIVILYKHRESLLVKSSSLVFNCITLVSGCLCCVSAILFVLPPSDAVCLSRSWLVPLTLTAFLSPLICKSFRIYRIFKPSQLRIVTVTDTHVVVGCAITMIPPILILLGFTISSNTRIHADTTWNGFEIQPFCSMPTELMVLLITSVASLVVFGATICFLIRDVPSAFNESVHLMFAIMFVVVYGVLILPLQLLVSNDPTALAILRGLGELVGVAVCCIVIYLPKLLLILSGHENDKKHVQISNHTILDASKRKGGNSSLHPAVLSLVRSFFARSDNRDKLTSFCEWFQIPFTGQQQAVAEVEAFLAGSKAPRRSIVESNGSDGSGPNSSASSTGVQHLSLPNNNNNNSNNNHHNHSHNNHMNHGGAPPSPGSSGQPGLGRRRISLALAQSQAQGLGQGQGQGGRSGGSVSPSNQVQLTAQVQDVNRNLNLNLNLNRALDDQEEQKQSALALAHVSIPPSPTSSGLDETAARLIRSNTQSRRPVQIHLE